MGSSLRAREVQIKRAGLALAALLSPTTARAQGELNLEVRPGDAAAACPGASSLRHAVAARVGAALASEPRRFEVSWLGARPWRAQVRVVAPDGRAQTRTLTLPGDGCAPLADAVVLAITLAIDPDWSPPTPPVQREASAPVPPRPGPRCEDPGPPAVCPPAPPSPRRLVPQVSIAAGVSLGVLAGPTATVGLEVELAPLPWLSALAAARWSPATVTADSALHIGLTRVDLGACARRPARLVVGACAGVAVGALSIDARAHVPLDVGDRPWAAAWFTALAELRLGGGWVTTLRARAVVPWVRYQGVVLGLPAPSFEAAPVGVEGEFSVGVQFL